MHRTTLVHIDQLCTDDEIDRRPRSGLILTPGYHCGKHHHTSCQFTAVKSNALAELMNRASKIHWKKLSLTLNGRNSETKNDKNNPKVPFFQYVQLFRNISFLLKWSFLAKICCCCQMCYFPKLSIFFKMCVVCKMFGLGHNVRFFQNGFCQNVCFW